MLKRLFDISISITLLALLSPLLLLVALLIVLDSAGRPLFLQERIGQGGKRFRIVKFRSMVRDAAQRGSYMTETNDPRITKIGAWLRATSIDELPQLWNVLKGEMSLVGPRPETPAQEALYCAEDWALRHRVKPGITGLSQVNGRSNASTEQRLRDDLDYARITPSVRVDIRILLHTARIVFARSGSN